MRKYSIGLFAACWTALPGWTASKITIVAIGDSTTAGTPFEKDRDAPYPAWLAKRRPQWDVRNWGVAGETTDQIRARFDPALALNPRFIIILGGVNDIYQEIPLEQVQTNLEYMVRRAKAKFAIPIIATVLPFDKATPPQNKQIADLNKFIAQLADKERIPFIDLHAVVAKHDDPTKLNGTPDGLHPDTGGYRAMALAILPVLDDMVKALPK